MNQATANQSNHRLIEMLQTALGTQITKHLEDPLVVEIMLNPDGYLWIERLGEECVNTGYKIHEKEAERIIYLIASSTGAVCNKEKPIISAEFPGSGNRFQGVLPPAATAPTFTIRTKAHVVYPLDNYIKDGIMTSIQKEAIVKAVRVKKNILIVGGTGSGKTTLINAILHEISETGDRIVIIEDTLELQCTAANKVFLRSNEYVSMNELLRATMRLRPDRIMVGEVRGPEALTLLKSWNTGHPGGVCSAHANSAYGGLTRLEQLILEAVPGPMEKLIAEAVNMVIYIERYQRSRRVKEIVTVEGFENGRYILKPVS